MSGWQQDNQVRGIFFSRKDTTPARFLLSAFKNRDRIKSALVHIYSPDAKKILTKYGVDQSKETLLMFKEDPKVPVATVSVSTRLR